METGGVKGSVTQNPGSVGSILNSTRGERAGKPSALGTGAENQGPSYCYADAILCYSSAFGGKDFLPQGLPCPSERAALHSKTLRKIADSARENTDSFYAPFAPLSHDLHRRAQGGPELWRDGPHAGLTAPAPRKAPPQIGFRFPFGSAPALPPTRDTAATRQSRVLPCNRERQTPLRLISESRWWHQWGASGWSRHATSTCHESGTESGPENIQHRARHANSLWVSSVVTFEGI